MEHEVDGRTLADLAAVEGTTERALANRFYKLRRDLAPRVAVMDDENKRRAVIFALFFFGAAAIVALLLAGWPLLFPPPGPPRPWRPFQVRTAAPEGNDVAHPPPPRPPVQPDAGAP